MVFPKNVSFLNFIRDAEMASEMVFLHMKTRNIARRTKLTITANIDMKVDIFAQKLVVYIYDDSSLELICCFWKPMNLS